MKTILLFFLSLAAVFAADPAQPTVGPTPVINATNGFGGDLTVRTQLNVGYPGQAGLIQISSTNGTFSGTLSLNDQGTFVLTDDVTDGASAVGFAFNTTNALSTSGAKLATFGNGGTNVVKVSPNGGLGIGVKAFESWDDPLNEGQVIYIASDNAFGEPGYTELGLSAISNQDFSTENFISLVSSRSQSKIQIIENDTGSLSGFVLYSLSGEPVFQATVAGNARISLEPAIADGSTPYTFDTSLAHTSGNLLEVKNNGSNRLTVGSDGTIANHGGTGSFISYDMAETSLSVVDFQSLIINVSGSSRTFLTPNTSDGSSSYLFDTAIEHTNGDMLNLRNHGTDIVSVDFAGVLSLTDGTLKPVKFSTVGSLPVGSKVLYVDP